MNEILFRFQWRIRVYQLEKRCMIILEIINFENCPRLTIFVRARERSLDKMQNGKKNSRIFTSFVRQYFNCLHFFLHFFPSLFSSHDEKNEPYMWFCFSIVRIFNILEREMQKSQILNLENSFTFCWNFPFMKNHRLASCRKWTLILILLSYFGKNKSNSNN